MAICCVVRPPHHLGGVAKSRSLFVATTPLILPRVKHGAGLLRRTAKYASSRLTNSQARREDNAADACPALGLLNSAGPGPVGRDAFQHLNS